MLTEPSSIGIRMYHAYYELFMRDTGKKILTAAQYSLVCFYRETILPLEGLIQHETINESSFHDDEPKPEYFIDWQATGINGAPTISYPREYEVFPVMQLHGDDSGDLTRKFVNVLNANRDRFFIIHHFQLVNN